ncbi:SRPBCC family protein [Halorubrum sp. Atlit-8R]|uniref:SRPBCC family protein n=1 Tax=unclassified Halorubrum TaxID=2642239 RepID=UPI000EF25D28|nr:MULTISPECIES: SRPBCC family protein [unclassified Halorubrum]RLM72222.1 SRPBCC family protein [Halorubrum sp. Atlit-9R]RLM83336.1 SRPBCC family protein [Halorubrum sp. Atlit-8R]
MFGNRDAPGSVDRGDGGSLVREGATLAVGRDVAAPPAATATALRDTRRWPEWSPSVSGVESSDRYVETGTTGRVRVAGAWVPFRVSSATRLRWDWEVAGIPATGHRVERYPEDPDRCRAVIEVPLLAAPYVPVCRRALDRFAALVEGE